MSGPAQTPRLEASAMVTVMTGPGMIAPENPTPKELANINIKGHIRFSLI
jgi:hypothetical protein